MKEEALVLSYAGCTTCKRALAWLRENKVAHRVRPIVEEPPSTSELKTWIPKSGVGIKKWLNTSGQSYRAMGKAKIDGASEADIVQWLAADGKLVKRPILVTKKGVLVGFRPEAWEEHFGA